MKSSFLKGDKRHSKTWPCNTDAKFIGSALEKSFSHMNICAYIFLKSFFSETRSPNLALALQPQFF